jgi:bla regulator protein blaR1
MGSQILLTFLLNACWQIVLIAALASFGSWLLRHSAARYRHWIWVSALFLSLGIPAVTCARIVIDAVRTSDGPAQIVAMHDVIPPLADNERSANLATLPRTSSALLVGRPLSLVLLSLYFTVLFYRAVRLVHAWHNTRRIRRTAVRIHANASVAAVIEKCQSVSGEAIRSARVKIHSSEAVAVPITMGTFNPVIILPERLVHESNEDLLISAIGHEFIHVRRQDYALNLAYELLYLPLAFHPAAALVRNRIRQTRELSCDELVAERILDPEVYARSLVKLANSAPPLRRLSVTTTVGIADADILEARIMSLLRKPRLNSRWRNLLLLGVSLLLVAPCLAAGAFSMRFDVDGQEPSPQEREKAEKEKYEMRERVPGSEEERKTALRRESQSGAMLEERRKKEDAEYEMKAVMQAALVRLAQVSMEQAIQIATSQTPGKVLQCSLIGEHWEEPGKLAKDGKVLYHVVILPDDGSALNYHVLVNAIDGTILKSERELPRKTRSPEQR